MKFTKKAQAKVLIISILLIMLITILVISGTFYISLSSQKEIETYYDELLNVTCSEGECGTINVSLDPIVQDEGPSYIGEGGSSWKFDVEKLDELDADIEYLGDNIFKLIPKINNESKVSKPDYKWKMQVNYTENSIKQNIKVREEMEKKDIGKEIIFTIPEGIENFKISIGETSTVIDGSVVQTALAYGENDNMCRDSNGMMHVSYIGDGEDLFYANSSDGGTWTTKELQSLITVHRTGITCDSEDNILVYYSDSDYVKMYNSSDGGVTFPTSYTIADIALDLDEVDCAVGSDDVTHCCMIDEDDQLEYANTSRLDYTTVISVADSDHCAIEIDNDNNIVIVVSETDTDDLDYMKRTDGSWGSRTTIAESLGTVSVANGAGISIAIDSENEWHISGTFGIDLQYCNGSDASFTCQEVDSSTSYNSNIASTENGEIYIFYASASSTDDGDVYRANSTDGVTWSTRVQVPSESSSGFPSIAHSNYPSWNNIFDTLHFVYVTQADVYYDNFSVDFPIYGLWTCDTDEDFSNASCWSYGVVPTAGIDVVFNSGGTGDCNITNGTMPQDLGSFLVDTDYGGTIYFNPLFAVGDWTGNNDGTQLWNVTNNINVSGGTMKIYGDYLHSAFTGVEGNITEDGHGQEWRSVSGDVIVGSGAVLDGIGLGFPIGIGQGYSTTGGTYGGRGNTNNVDPYGNAIAPTSLGGSSDVYAGSSAIKLHANNIVNVEGNILVDGNGAWNQEGSSGGSIWLEGNSIIVIGSLNASGGNGRYHPGGGGRIRLEYGSNMNYTGYIGLKGGKSSVYPGTLTFTNNTWPGDWNIKGTVGLLGGDYGEGEVVNILGNFNSGGDIFIYGDCFSIRAVPKDYVCYNTTNVGQGVWINASGNITLNSGDMIDGIGLGFYIETGPGYASSDVGVSHGGRGAANTGPAVYGSETQPTSLGSGASFKYQGGSAVKLQTNEIINIIGNINMNGLGGLAGYLGPSGGSIYLISDNITISGDLSSEGSSGYYGSGGGGRIALYGDKISLSGNINNNGGLRTSYGGGGTVYINASTSITSSGNIITRGYDGGNITFNDTLLTLSGTYNATGINNDANIFLDYSDCSSTYSSATFDPTETDLIGCDKTNPLISFVEPPTPENETSTSNTSIQINVSITEANLDEVKYNWNGTNYSLFDDSLVLMMNFDNVSALGENQTHVVDVSGNGNNGSVVGDGDEINITGAGRYGSGGLELDGSGDYVDVPITFPPGSFSIGGWVWLDSSTSGYDSIGGMDKSEEGNSGLFYFQKYNGDYFKFVVTNTVNSEYSSTDAVTTTKETWTYLVGVYNDNNKEIKLYKNGVQVGSTGTLSGTRATATGNLVVGGAYYAGSKADYWVGSIDEVRIYNRSLSSDEIQQLYMSNLNKYDTDKWSLYVNQSKNATDGLDVGNYTYFASAKDENNNENITGTRTITIVSDTCTCPSVDTNWEVNMEDYCNLTTSCNIGLGNLSWIGSFGYFNCSSELNLSNRNTPISSTIFYYYNGCQVNRL